MKKRILAILALVFFALGVVVFFYCIAAKRTDLSLYAVIFCAPGAALALFEWLTNRRTRENAKDHTDDPSKGDEP